MKIILAIGLVISAIFAVTEALKCIPACDSPARARSPRLACTPVYKLNCKGGIVKNLCGCCAICASVKGERCGGPWDIYGKCDSGLTCYRSPPDIARYGATRSQGTCVPK